jgi:hypothetical protein
VSKETARKYLHFDLNSFVATNPSIKWCPKPGCGMAVKLPECEQVRKFPFHSDFVDYFIKVFLFQGAAKCNEYSVTQSSASHITRC